VLGRVPVLNVLLGCVLVPLCLAWLVTLALTWLRYGMLRVPGVAVVIGADGIRLDRTFRKTFIPFEDIRDLRHSAEGLALDLRTGEQMVLQPNRAVDPWDLAEHAPILEAFRRSFDRWREQRELLAEHEFDAEESRLGPGAPYRVSPVTVDHLWRLGENPAVRRRVRIAALEELFAREGGAVRLEMDDLVGDSADDEFVAAVKRLQRV